MRSMRGRKKPEERGFSSTSSASTSARNTLVQQQAVQDKAMDLIRSGDVEALLALLTPPPPPEQSPMSPPFEAQTPTQTGTETPVQVQKLDLTQLANTLQLPHTKQGTLALGVAAEEGRVDCAEAVLSVGVAVDLRDAQGMTALLLAAKYGAPEAMITLLIQHKADVHATHPVTRENALFLASKYRHTPLVRLFLTEYAMSDSVDSRNAADETPLWNAVKEKQFPLADLLIAHKADVNARQSATGSTPLIAAAFNGDSALDTVQFLLRNRADVCLCTHSGESALSVAARHGHVAIIDALCAHSLTLTPADSSTDLHQHSDNPQDVLPLIDRRDSMGRTPLIAACLTQKESAVRTLLSQKASVDIADKWKYTPLIFTARSPPHTQAQAQPNTSLTICELLLEGRASVDLTDNYGLTAFMHAGAKGNWPVAKRLLVARANPHHTDREGRSVLQLSRSDEERETLKMILEEETAA